MMNYYPYFFTNLLPPTIKHGLEVEEKHSLDDINNSINVLSKEGGQILNAQVLDQFSAQIIL